MKIDPYNWHDDKGIIEDCAECRWFNRRNKEEPCINCYYRHSAYEKAERREK